MAPQESFPGYDVHKNKAGGFTPKGEKPRPFEISVDGLNCEAYEGELLIEAINRAGRELAQVCYHPQLGPIQTCDTCMVELNGTLVRACGTKAEPGARVLTATPAAKTAQGEAFDVILGNHLLYCTVCDNNNGNCTVHNTTHLLNVEHQKTPFKSKRYAVDESNPFYRYDPDQCILCGRCVEACQNVQVNETLSIRWEDAQPRVLWDGGKAIGESSCVSCGHCVSVCPCNALMEKSMIGHAGFFTSLPKPTLNHMIDAVKGVEPSMGFSPILEVSQVEAAMRAQRIRKTKTVCTYCGVGCSFDIWTKDREILKVEPFAGPANGISTCIKGKFGWDYTNHEDRLRTPLIRDGEGFREASWYEALELIATRFAETKRKYGPDALAFVSSSKCTNEESYLMQKLARAVIGTHNVDNCSRYCQSPATQGLFRTVGYGGDSGSISDIAKASLVLIVGSNTAENHPVLATRVKRAHKLHGQKLIVADLRKHEMARRADIFMKPNPGTDMVWLSALSKYIIDNGWQNQAFIDQWVNKFDEYRESLAPFTIEFAEKVSGIPAETLKQVAELISKEESVCILWAMGVTQHSQGSDCSTACSNILLVTGNYMRPGTGAYPLRGHNNVQGTSDFGSMPNFYPGYQKIEDENVRRRYEESWGVKLPLKKGLDNHEMVESAISGDLKSLYIIGEDMVIADSNSNRNAESFSQIPFLVVQDCFFSQTCQFADVILPASPLLEKDGTVVSTERRIQRLYQVFEPLAESRPDWEIIRDIANRLGANWTYTHPSQIMEEIASCTPLFAGVTYDRLAGYSSLQWPVSQEGQGQPLLYTKGFPFDDGKAKFHLLQWLGTQEKHDQEFNLHLNNGRLLEHFHEGHMTYRVSGIREEIPSHFVEMSPELARELGVNSGRWIRLRSPHGQVRTQLLVTDRVSGRDLYMPINSATRRINGLTSSATDKDAHTPAYKEVSVNLEVLPENGVTPLPITNHRYGHPTPQNGVEVERKWNREDYRLPGSRNGQKLVQIEVKQDKQIEPKQRVA
ncbi:MAG TPA: formate dehydrogenase subunit alpha [Candidatus Saccharimonadales bacterium]|nr:formate dehydrogenase subunit alpha [Candidatus Saccharimonadales bacterium]